MSETILVTGANRGIGLAVAKVLDILINMAGIMPGKYDAKLEDLNFDDCRKAYETNTLGPLRITRYFLPLLRKSKKARVINVTSGLGSISGTDNPNFYAYGGSKAALNKVTRTLALELKKENIVAIVLDPGWVKTDMGGPNAWLTPEESSTAIVKTAKALSMDQTSLFIYNDGKELKW
jgi:NAD(P)-dependent dehydrogenase (short-subunit alcohol dehydrogenase family)